MNKEITCRMIDGKPVVEYKEEYVPKRGDIVVSGHYANSGDCHWMNVYGEKTIPGEYWAQASIRLKEDYKKGGLCSFRVDQLCSVQTYTRKATFEEEEVMLHILHENGYDLIGTEVVKKRWVPIIGDTYWYTAISEGKFMPMPFYVEDRDDIAMVDEINCFKTEQACQYACDKANELFLTLPQE